ncbi:uncharacterized protein RJT20DRAFT_123858 [Scheffersomyces xylosifermentans]|uniref:uncharacterized protein n=1 Tax=Scheffersomyces xylosifermentans TaxID=1304137 RepID=UPI00315DE6CC
MLSLAKTGVRRLSSSSRNWAEIYTRTTINPVNYKLNVPSKIKAESVIVVSTPSNLPQVIEEAINVFQSKKIQVCVAGVDSVVPNSSRNGVSELWLSKPFQIKSSVLLEDRDDLNNKPRESDGVNIVVARKNWKNIDSNLQVVLNEAATVDLKLANTVFSTNHLVTLFYFQPENEETHLYNSGQTLCDLTIELPKDTVPVGTEVKSYDRWTPLYDNSVEGPFLITNCIGNLLKQINNKSASGYLEKNNKLMSLGSKDTKVYVKLYKQNNPEKAFKYEVIAGGGGWGAKASTIALSPDAKLEKGDRVEFFMLTPSDRFSKQESEVAGADLQGKLTFEATYEEQAYADGSEGKKAEVLENVFGCGSEEEFKFNGVKHSSAGERLTIDL